MQRQTAVTAYMKSKQLLLFVFEQQDSLLPSSCGILTAEQRQTAVTAYLPNKQLLLFVFGRQQYKGLTFSDESDNDGFFASGDKSEPQLRIPGEVDLARLRYVVLILLIRSINWRTPVHVTVT